MKIKSIDHYLEIGSTHDDCQDFTVSGMINQNLAFAILSDGCSASHDLCREVDFGARIICYAAKKQLMEQFKNVSALTGPFTDADVHGYLTKASGVAEEQRKFFGLHPNSIDATLLIMVSDGNRHNVIMYGDGAIIYRQGKEMHLNLVDFESGAPFYPSYSLSASRMQAYQNEFGKSDVVLHKTIIGEDGAVTKRDLKLQGSFTNFFHLQTNFSFEGDIPFVALTSDGVKSFQKPHPDYPEIIQNLDAETMLPQMFGYKNFVGQFVKRRMNVLKKEAAKIKMAHYDDVSVAAIAME